MNSALVLLVVILSFGCTRAPIKEPSDSLRQASHLTQYIDDLEYLGLFKAMTATIARLRENPNSMMRFGNYEISAGEYARDLELLVQEIDSDGDGSAFRAALKRDFEALEVYGTDEGWGEVFVTSYFTPEIPGSLRRTKKYSEPIYARPKDMVKVPIRQFVDAQPSLQDRGLEDLIRDGRLRGRLEKSGDQLELVPYWSRAEMSQLKKSQRPKVLAWADPVDLFFLQIQGSGRLRISKNKYLNLNYADQNGHPYYPIGRALKEVIPPEEMSMQSIEGYLRKATKSEAERVLNLNASYVYFEKGDELAMTAFGLEAQAGRTIATDRKYFPKGAFGYLEYPALSEDKKGGSRFILDHDTGGAIRGPGRVDLYWGVGDLAEEVSGRMQGEGKLYYFVPKRLIYGVTSTP